MWGMGEQLTFGDSSSNDSRDMQQRSRRMWYFDRCLSFGNCQPGAFSDVIFGAADQDVGMDACANFGDSR